MATGKRYYWIKLKDSFMSSDAIDYLMSQPDGANYVVLYQMLCLKTINTGGCLVSKIGEMLIPYDVEKIQRECKWFSLATVRVALEVYKQIGLVFENPDGTLSISDYSEMIGSETDWAAKKRRQTLQAANSPLSIGESGRDTTGENLPIEKEIDKDKEKDKDSNVIAYDRTCNTYWKIKCRYIPTFYPGTGDAYTSVMIGSLLDGDSLPIALDKGVQFITQAIKASYGFDYPNREGVLLERVLEVLKMPVVLGGYEMI